MKRTPGPGVIKVRIGMKVNLRFLGMMFRLFLQRREFVQEIELREQKIHLNHE